MVVTGVSVFDFEPDANRRTGREIWFAIIRACGRWDLVREIVTHSVAGQWAILRSLETKQAKVATKTRRIKARLVELHFEIQIADPKEKAKLFKQRESLREDYKNAADYAERLRWRINRMNPLRKYAGPFDINSKGIVLASSLRS